MLEPASKGLKLELRPQKTSYNNGDLPVFDAVITNISSGSVTLCTYLIKHRLLTSLMGNGYEVYPFKKTSREPLKDSDFLTLAPGQSHTVRLDVRSEPGYEFMYAGHLPPVVNQEMRLTGFPTGAYTFKAYLGGHVSFYNAPDGQYNHARDRKHILTQIPKEGVSVDTSGAWDGEMQTSCTVSFS